MILILIKLIVTVVIVVGLSSVAERVSPRVAGVLAGYPLGSSIVLFFFGVEYGALFAAESAIYMMAGLVAELIFLFCYYKISDVLHSYNIIISSLIALIGYIIAIWSVHLFNFTPITATFLYLISLVIFTYLFRLIPDHKVQNRVKLTWPVIVLRATLAGCIVLLITWSARLVGSSWAGLLGAFPTTLYPLILIIHWTYGKEYAHTFIKHVPRGLWSLLVYVICVIFLYPSLGVYYGTLASLAFATVYLVVYSLVRKTP